MALPGACTVQAKHRTEVHACLSHSRFQLAEMACVILESDLVDHLLETCMREHDDNIKSKSFSFHTGLPAIAFVCVVSSLAMIRISFEQIMLKKIRLDCYRKLVLAYIYAWL